MTPKEIEIERARLLASILNTVAASSLSAGVLLPVIATLSGLVATPAPLRRVALGAALCLFMAVALHSYARGVLERLADR